MKTIKVGLGTCGISAGGELVFNKLKGEIESRHLDIDLKETGCMGMCYEEVLIEVNDGNENYLYSKVTVDKVGRIIMNILLIINP
jgi:NADH-quinone oxidoreductase subunit F